MANVNTVIIVGNLTSDPVVKYTPNSVAVANFSLALNRKFTSNNETKEETCFVDVTVWSKQAESVGKYLTKGKLVCVEGRLSQDTWKDKDSGANRSKLYVTAERVQFLSPVEQQGNPANQANPPPPPPPAPQTAQVVGTQDDMAVDYNIPPAQQAPQHAPPANPANVAGGFINAPAQPPVQQALPVNPTDPNSDIPF